MNTYTKHRPISVIAQEIVKTWKNIDPHALPYLEAMYCVDAPTDKYLLTDAEALVLYFLSNSTNWRGADAQRLKAELRALLPKK
jgi:hypothetical protein